MNYKVIEELSPFENKIFESITIKLDYPGKKSVLLTSAYRSNGYIPGTTAAQQLERFYVKFDELLYNCLSYRMDSYVFMDSNIDLLDLRSECATTFLDAILSKGFLQCITKATRFQDNSKIYECRRSRPPGFKIRNKIARCLSQKGCKFSQSGQ